MATDIERLTVVLEANIKKYEKEMARTRQVVDKAMRDVEQRTQQAASRIEKMMGTAASRVAMGFRQVGAAAGAYLSLGALKLYADAWTESANKIAAAGEATGSVAQRQKELADLAIRTRSEFGATVELYTGLSRSTAELGATQAQVAQATETINKAFSVGGQSASAASGAILQLNQAMAAGALRGDELNSILEGAPPLARLIAKEFGVSIGQLKKLGEDGKLTADRIFKAILNGSKEIDAQFAKTNSTIGQSLTNLNTALTAYVGQADKANGSSAKIAGLINGIANNAEVAIPALVAFGVALAVATGGLSLVGSAVAGGATALYLFSDALRPISGELATLADYAAVAFDMATRLGGEAAKAIQAAFAQAADYITTALSSVGIDGGQTMEFLVRAIKAQVNGIIGTFVFMAKTVLATWNNLGAALAETIVNAMNGVIATIQSAVQAIVGAINGIIQKANSLSAIVSGPQFDLMGGVDLGRIENRFAGAGETAGKAYGEAFKALTADYIGQAASAVGDALQEIRNQANIRAQDSAEQSRRNNQAGYTPQSTFSGNTSNLHAAPGSGDGKKGKKNEYEREIANMEKRIGLMNTERETLGRSAFEATKAEAAFRLLEAAKQANVPVTDALRANVDKLATAYALASTQLEEAKAAQERYQQTMQELGGVAKDALGGFISDLREGKDAAAALENMLSRVADRLLDMAINSIFDSKGGGGLLGSLLGGLTGGGGGLSFNPTGRAGGGPVKAGVGYTVGESGRETFVPTTPGRIVPNGKGGGLQVVVNNMAGAQVGTRQERAPNGDMRVMLDVVKADMMRETTRNGTFSKALGAPAQVRG